jgi:hypothetical protein
MGMSRLRYSVILEGRPHYQWCGPELRFYMSRTLALKYVSYEVAAQAIKVIEKLHRKDFPNCSPLAIMCLIPEVTNEQ